MTSFDNLVKARIELLSEPSVDRKIWEHRIENCIQAKKQAEDPDMKVLWDQTLKVMLQLAKADTLKIH